MTKGFSIKFSGLDDLNRTLTKRARDILKVNKAMKIVAFMVEGDVKRNQRVGVTGNLRNSTHVINNKPLLWKVSDGVFYGIFQEKGTSRGISGNYVFRDALRNNRAFLIRSIKRIYSKPT